MTTKEELRELIDAMDEEQAERLLDFINLQNDPDFATPEEIAEHELLRGAVARGDYVTFEELRAEFKV